MFALVKGKEIGAKVNAAIAERVDYAPCFMSKPLAGLFAGDDESNNAMICARVVSFSSDLPSAIESNICIAIPTVFMRSKTDTYSFPATVQLWRDLLQGWAAVSRAAHRNRVPKSLPLYLIAGGRDPVSGNTRQLAPWMADYRAAGRVNLAHKFYSEARHELFNETNRDEVTRDLIGWLDKVVARGK